MSTRKSTMSIKEGRSDVGPAYNQENRKWSSGGLRRRRARGRDDRSFVGVWADARSRGSGRYDPSLLAAVKPLRSHPDRTAGNTVDAV